MRVSGSRGNCVFHARSSGATVTARQGEEKFKVFAVAERLREGAAAAERDLLCLNREAAAARGGKPREIGGQAVAQIHHRVGFEMRGEPARFGEPRDEIEVAARGERSAEAPGDIEHVPWLSAGTEHASLPLDHAVQRDGAKERPGRADRFAPDDGDAEAPARAAQPAVELPGASEFHFRRKRQGDERRARDAAHRRNIADRATNRFPSHPAQIFPR